MEWTDQARINRKQNQINILTVICIFCMLVFVMQATNVFPWPDGTFKAKIAPTGSMFPFIDHTMMVVERNLTENEYIYLGDLYVYEYWDADENRTVRILHRCIGQINESHYIFRGDANVYSDPPVARDQITAKVVGIEME